MTDPLSALLARRGVALADGAAGTNLFNMGLPPGTPPEGWNLAAPDRVRALYQGWVDAGADLFLTNTFGANAARWPGAPVADIALAGAVLARQVADAAGRAVLVAGSLGPTGQIMAPMGRLSHAEAVAIHLEQARALAAGGVDLLWAETLTSAQELRAMAEAVQVTGLPWVVTMSFDTSGRTMMGLGAADLVRAAGRLAWPPVAIGANCGLGAADLLRTILEMSDANSGFPLIAKGNAGIPRQRNGRIEHDASPARMADYALLARDAGAAIIGGCCGTTGDHLRAMRVALDATPPGPRPTLDLIAARLGGFHADPDLAPPSAGRRRS